MLGGDPLSDEAVATRLGPGPKPATAFPGGMIEPGTQNPLDARYGGGTVSHEFTEGGIYKEVLIPNFVDGKPLSDEEAIERYRQTGEHFGKFDSPANANAFVSSLTNPIQPASASGWEVLGEEPLTGAPPSGAWEVLGEEPLTPAVQPATGAPAPQHQPTSFKEADEMRRARERAILQDPNKALLPMLAKENVLAKPGEAETPFWETVKKEVQNLPAAGKQWLGSLVRAIEENPNNLVGEEGMQLPEQEYLLRAKAQHDVLTNGGIGKKMYDEATKDIEANAPNVRPFSAAGIASTSIQSAPYMVGAAVTTFLTRSPLLGAATMIPTTGVQEYGQERAEGVSPEKAMLGAAVNGFSEALGEEIPLGMMMKPGGRFLLNTLKTAGAEGIQEALTQIIQTGYDMGVLHPEMTWGQAWTQVVQAGIVGTVMGGGMHVAAHPFVGEEEGAAAPTSAQPEPSTEAAPGAPPAAPTTQAPATPAPAEPPPAAAPAELVLPNKPRGKDWVELYEEDGETQIGWHNPKTGKSVTSPQVEPVEAVTALPAESVKIEGEAVKRPSEPTPTPPSEEELTDVGPTEGTEPREVPETGAIPSQPFTTTPAEIAGEHALEVARLEREAAEAVLPKPTQGEAEPQAAPEEAAPRITQPTVLAGWDKSVFKARDVAKGLGIAWEGKKLGPLSAEINAAMQERGIVAQPMKRATPQKIDADVAEIIKLRRAGRIEEAQDAFEELSQGKANPDYGIKLNTALQKAVAKEPPVPEGTRAAPIKEPETDADLEAARAAVNTEPTEAQAEAGNYAHGHVQLHGMDISIETPKGAERRGKTADGKEWVNVNPLADYGYVKKSEGADDEQVDVYIGPDPQSNRVFVVDQHDPKTGAHDEHKAILGADTPEQALAIYDAGFSDGSGPSRRPNGGLEMSIENFKRWLKEGDTKKAIVPQSVAPESETRSATVKQSESERGSVQQVPEGGAAAGPAVLPGLPRGAHERVEKAPPEGKGAAAASRQPKGGTRPPPVETAPAFDPLDRHWRERGLEYVRSGGTLRQQTMAKALGIKEGQAGRLLNELAKNPSSGIFKSAAQNYRRIPRSEGPEDVLSFLARRGGIRDDEGHDLIKGRNLQRLVPGVGPLIRPTGMAIDKAGEALVEAGYFGPQATTGTIQESDVLDLIENAYRKPAFRAEDEGHVSKANRERLEASSTAAMESAVARSLKDAGEEFGDKEIDEIVGIMRDAGMDAEDAVFQYIERLALSTEGDLARETKDQAYEEIPYEGGLAETGGQAGEGLERPQGKVSDTGQGEAGGEAAQEVQSAPAEEAEPGRPAEQVAKAAAFSLEAQAAPKAKAKKVEPQTSLALPEEPRAKQIAAAKEFEGQGRIAAGAKQETAGQSPLFDVENRKQTDLVEAAKSVSEKPKRAAAPPAEKPPQTARMIEDAGEKIGGARKDQWAERGLRITDLEGMSEGEAFQYTTKDGVWPKPDYAKMVEGGATPEAAAYVKVIRDRLAAKPDRDSATDRRDYVTMMGHVRNVLEAVKTVDDAKAAVAKIRKAAGWPDEGSASQEVRKRIFSVYKGRTDPFRVGWDDASKVKKLLATGFPGKVEPWTRRFDIHHATQRVSRAGTDIPEAWFVTAKGSHRILSDEHPTKEIAEAKAKELYEASIKKGENGERLPERPHLDKIERTGRDVRDKRNITSDDFVKDFGFRGVEFGNWVASDERQKSVNLAYEALHDLASILNVPVRALSLDGHLGLAFGARGSGKFAAHYEPGKLVINLTKMSGAGSLAHEWGHAFDHYFGTLGKEASTRGAPEGASGWYTRTAQRKSHLGHLRAKMADAFDRLMTTMFHREKPRAEAIRDLELRIESTRAAVEKHNARIEEIKDEKVRDGYRERSKDWLESQDRQLKFLGEKLAEARDETKPYTGARVNSSYYEEAMKLSGKSAEKGYWTRPTELFARAFESYAFDKIKAAGNASQYLVQGVESDRYAKGYKGNPYPSGKERDAINSAFDHLFDVMEVGEGEEDERPLFQVPKPAPTFYSALTREIENATQKKASAGQWQAFIRNAAQRGVKQDEVDWSGVKEWIAGHGDKPITKEALLDFIRANNVQIKEVMKGGARDTSGLFPEDPTDWTDRGEGKDYADGTKKTSILRSGDATVTMRFNKLGEVERVSALLGDADLGDFGDFIEAREALIRASGVSDYVDVREKDGRWWTFDMSNGRYIADYATRDGALDAAEELDRQKPGAAKFSTYTLPGGTDYHELLLTLPEKNRLDAAEASERDLLALRGMSRTDAQDARFRSLNQRYERGVADNFRSGHFEEPNVLAHIRFNDRTTSDGKKTLFIEEIQSDWHQRGRKYGYREPFVEVKPADLTLVTHIDVGDAVGSPPGNQKWTFKTTVRDLGEIYGWGVTEEQGVQDAMRSANSQMQRSLHADRVPAAPFKTTWPELAFKRAVRYAAENGYDQIAWTTGEIQADRYDLSQHVSRVVVEVLPDGRYKIEMFKRNGSGVRLPTAVEAKSLPDWVGKDLADKIINDLKGQDGKPTGGKTYSGLDLRVGGEGMKGFYDKILPAFASRYGKKWGAQVGETELKEAADFSKYTIEPAGNYWRLVDALTGALIPDTPRFKSGAAAEKWIADNIGGAKVHAIPITPAMRESVMQGQPLFKRGNKAPTGWEEAETGTGEERVIFPNARGTTLRGEPVAELTDKQRQLVDEVLALVKRMAPQAEAGIRVMQTLRMGNFPVHGAVASQMGKRVIAIALEIKGVGPNPDLVGTTRHELIHWLRSEGFILPEEWAALERAAKEGGWIRKHQIDTRYPKATHTLEEQLEEAIAEEFGIWRRERPRIAPRIKSVFQRMASLLQRIRAIAQRMFGPKVTAEDVFGRIESGDLTKREPVKEHGRRKGQQFQVADPTDSEAFRKWFGKSKVVDKDGSPKVVYHGTEVSFDKFERSEDIGFHFGSEEAANTALMHAAGLDKDVHTLADLEPEAAEGHRVLPVYLKIEKPLRLPDLHTWDPTNVLGHLAAKGIISDKQAEKGGIIDREFVRDALAKKGYDGIVYRNETEGGGDSYIVFDPGQIKSIFNRGTFDPEDERIMFARPRLNPFEAYISDPQPGVVDYLRSENMALFQRLKGAASPAAIGESIDRWRQGFQDRFLPVLRMQRVIEEQLGRRLTEGENPYLSEELSTGRKGAKLEDLTEKMVRPLIEDMTARKVSREDLEAYLYARHAPERNARMQEINPKFREEGMTGSGMSDEDAAAIMAAVDTAGRREDMDALAAKVDAILEFAVNERVEAGLLSEEQADEWRTTYEHYVPLRGLAELDPEVEADRPRTGGRFNVRGRESYRAFGRQTPARDLLAYSIMQAEEAIIRGENNRIGNAIYDLAKAAPNEKFWKTDKVAMRPHFIKAKGEVEYRPVRKILAEDKDYTISLKIDGKEHRVTFNRTNPVARNLALAMKGLGQDQIHLMVQYFGVVNRMLSHVNTTLNPEFVITNAFRDMQTALTNLQQFDLPGITKGTIKDWPKALRGAMLGSFKKEGGEWTRWYDEFRQAGGRVYFNQMESVHDLRKRLERDLHDMQTGFTVRKAFRTVGRTIENVNLGVENAIRLAAYKNARERGMSPAQAASLAKNLTVNFNRRGSWGPLMNSLYLFYNASVQGAATILTAMKSPKVRRVLAAAVVVGFLMEMLNALTSDRDDDGELVYDKITPYDKSRNLIIPDPVDSRHPFKIPLPYGYNSFFALGRSVAELLRGKQAMEVAGNFATTVVDSFNPIGGAQNILNLIAPTVADPVVDLYRNRDYAERPIKPDQSQYGRQEPESQRYWNTVSPQSKVITDALSEATGGTGVEPGLIEISPETLDYLFGQVFGAAGTFYERNFDLLAKLADPTAELNWNDIPFARRVIGGEPPWYDKSMFFERTNAIRQAVGDYREYIKRGEKPAAEAFKQRNKALLGMEREASAVRNRYGDIRTARANAQYQHDQQKITDSRYREILDKAKADEEKLIGDFNRDYIKRLKQ